MGRALSVLGAPSSAGAYAPGQEKAPAAFRRHGLIEALSRARREVVDRGDVAAFRWRPDPAHATAMNLAAVRDTAQAVAERTAAALAAGHDLLLLGGDCTVELGAVAGAIGRFASVALVYIDGDTDLNPPEASDGALDWTGVAHLLDLPGATEELAGLGGTRPMLGSEDVLFFAAGTVQDNEAATIRERGLACVGLAEAQADPGAAARRAVEWARRFECVLVHLDADVLNFAAFPIAENTRRDRGLTLEELDAVLLELRAMPTWRVLTVAEVNPDHAPDESETFARLNAMLTRALGDVSPTPGTLKAEGAR
jgi:arginase